VATASQLLLDFNSLIQGLRSQPHAQEDRQRARASTVTAILGYSLYIELISL